MPISMHITHPSLPQQHNHLCHPNPKLPQHRSIRHHFPFLRNGSGHSYSSRCPFTNARSRNALYWPIPFLLHLSNIAYNFVYRNLRTANEWELWYFSSRDPDMSRATSRHFFWMENILWKDELEGKHVCVVLSGDDEIVDAGEVRKYLTGGEEERW